MTVKQRDLPSAGQPCGSGSQIVYAWAQDAPGTNTQACNCKKSLISHFICAELHLPDDVGFRVGGDSGINWLVLQVRRMPVRAGVKVCTQTFSSLVCSVTPTENVGTICE